MLFLLTSEVQTGKTRWLEALVKRLSAQGVVCAGVLAPGVWREKTDAELAQEAALMAAGRAAGEFAGERFEKLGIDNVLLPSGERIPFGRRTDLAQQEGTYDEKSQSGKMQLGWTIFDEAIDRVNVHFAKLREDTDPELQPSLLVVDEIGRLELQRGGGLVEAMQLLREGPSEAFPHALVVVREWLIEKAEEQFAPAWGLCVRVTPTDEGVKIVEDAFLFGDAYQRRSAI